MANEHGIKLEDLTAVDETEEVVQQEEIVESGVTLPLRREAFRQDGKEFNSYFVPLKVFGKSFKLELRPKENDYNAYFFLNCIFGESGETVLYCAEGVMRDSSTKKKTVFKTYLVKGVDPESGFPVSVALRPFGDSNKRMLEELYRQKLEQLKEQL